MTTHKELFDLVPYELCTDCSVVGLHFQTFYDSPQVALIVPSLQAMRRTRACVRPYHGLVPRFSPENGGKIKDSPENWGKIRKVLLASVSLANTLRRSWLTRRLRPFHSPSPCFLERLRKFSASPSS